MKIKNYLLIFFCVSFFLKINAQTYNFKNYSEDNGLAQTYIYHIAQSKEGFLTFSTGEGYATFDGIRFQPFSTKRIADNFVNTHFNDSRNITWLGHFQNGVTYIKNGKPHELKNKELEGYKVSQFQEGINNTVWFSTLGGGLFYADSAFNIKQVKTEIFKTVNSFLIDGDNLVAATSEGLKIFKIRANRSLLLVYEARGFFGKNIKQIVRSGRSKHIFWLSVEGEGVYGVSSENKFEEFIHFFPELKSSKNNIAAIYSDKSDNLWISLFGEGLRKISFKDKIKKENADVSVIEQKNGLKSKFIQSIFQDAEGNMWFGTFGAGLIEKPTEKFAFYGNDDGILHTNIFTVALDTNKNIWLGSDKGLACFNTITNSYVNYNSKNGFITDKVNSLLIDNENNLWIGTDSNGIYRFNLNTRKFEDFSKLHHLSKVSVNSITQTSQNILISTKEGVYLYNMPSKAVSLTTMNEGLFHNNVQHIYVDSKQRQWISSNGAPPYFIKDLNITAFKDIPELKSFNVHAMCEDKNGNIWIATGGDGIFKYNGQTFSNYTVQDGLLSDYCYGVEVDRNNSVWVTHRNGLSEKRNFQKTFHAISGKDGLLYYENNLNAIFHDADGDLWFGTAQGILHYDAEIGNNTINEPKLSITKITLNDSVYDLSKKIIKKYGHYSTRVDFLAISLTDPDKTTYKYRLLGLDSAWKNTVMRYVDFPKLGDGDYTFQVIACNGKGECNMTPVEFSFMINEPLWKKPWLYILISALLVLSTYYIIYLRTRRLKRTQQILQGMVVEKTQLLQQEKEEVEKVKTQLEEKNKDITDSINYAKKIQEALLPSKKMILEKLPETIIYYKPRDIVSGDFYWFAETEKSYIIAAIDCTGHGVPGAFMSLIGSTLLNEIIYDYQIIDPGKILEELNEKLTKTLNQVANVNSSYDGMDMSVCSIAKDKKSCVFSGAHRPIYVINEYGLKEIKGSPLSIGGNLKEGRKIFEEHFIHLNKGDMLYIFSDGFSDQFNEMGKKFTTKRFKSTILDIHMKDVKTQYNTIKEKFEAWTGNGEQIDDVLVIGLKV